MQPRYRPRDRWSRITLAIGLALLAIPTLSGLALAKDGGLVRVQPPIRLDALPGTTMEVRFEPFQLVDGDAEIAWTGSTFVVRLIADDSTGTVTRFPARERPADSGRYVATVIVPDNGLADVEIGLLGENCVQGVCTISDLPFELTEGSVVAVAAAPEATAVVRPAAQPATVPIHGSASPPSTLVALAFALAIALGVSVLVLAASRLRPGPRSRPRAPDR